MTKIPLSVRAALFLAFAAAVGGCSDDALRGCAVPEGTVPFSFESGGSRLSGFIDSPAAPGPHPAILLIHDDGPTDITNGSGDFAYLRAAFRRIGLASVVWDKAGSGCSDGRYGGLADLYRRADEVLNAVSALQMRDDIDAERIGAWAMGQGGWVAPMAAVRSDELAFLIVVGGPGRDPIHEGVYLASANLERAGYTAVESRALVERLEQAWAMMDEQANYDDYAAVAEPLAEHPLFETLIERGADVYATEERYDELRGSGALDVSADVFLPAVDIPVLAIWGNQDSQVDWQEAVQVYRESFADDRASNLTVSVFEDADHALCNASTGALDDPAARSDCELAEGYLDTMTAWLQAHGFTASEQSASF